MISYFEIDRLPQGYYAQTGTVLQRRDSAKEGQSLQLFLRDLGPRWVNAPAASGKNRFGGATEPLVWGEFCLYQSPKYLYLKGAEIKEDFLSLRDDASRLMTALRFYKMVSKVVMATHESNQILTLLWSAMILLKENCPAPIVEFRFAWKLLNALGLAPSLQQCVKCGGRLDTDVLWSQDGFICRHCINGIDKNVIRGRELRNIQAAALLNHLDFIEWSRTQNSFGIYDEHLKKLITFFSDIR